MLQIPCPYCGLRDEIEFTWGGEAHVQRPPQSCTDEAWAAYLFFRDNARGYSLERWRHSFGCAQWFNVARNTVTHEVLTSYRMGEAPPSVAARDARKATA